MNAAHTLRDAALDAIGSHLMLAQPSQRLLHRLMLDWMAAAGCRPQSRDGAWGWVAADGSWVESDLASGALVDAVYAHAEANYGNGWDEVVEAWDKADIEEVIEGASTEDEAVAAMTSLVDARNAYQRDIRGAGGWYDDADGEVSA